MLSCYKMQRAAHRPGEDDLATGNDLFDAGQRRTGHARTDGPQRLLIILGLQSTHLLDYLVGMPTSLTGECDHSRVVR